jgi:hypothetical protein
VGSVSSFEAGIPLALRMLITGLKRATGRA